MRLRQLRGWELEVAWPELSGPLQKTLDESDPPVGGKRRYTSEWVLERLVDGRLEIREFLSEQGSHGWMVGGVVPGAELLVYFVWWVYLPGSGRRVLIEAARAVFDLARRKGCAVVEGEGRPGWKRLLSAFGVEPSTSRDCFRTTTEEVGHG